MNRFIKTSCVIILLSLLLTSCGSTNTGSKETEQPKFTPEQVVTRPDTWNYTTSAPKTTDISDSSKTQARWMSIPNSRLVVNPYPDDHDTGDYTQSQLVNDYDLPLNIGYLDPLLDSGRNGRRVMDAIYVLEDNLKGDKSAETTTLDFANVSRWSAGGGYKAEKADGKLKITVSGQGGFPLVYENAAEVDFGRNPVLRIRIDSIINNDPEGTENAVPRWALFLNVQGNDAIRLQWDIADSGTYTYDLNRYAQSIRGVKMVGLTLYAINQGTEMTVSDISITESEDEARYSKSSEYSTEWAPDKLLFSAKYPDGMEVNGADYFYDEKTVVRSLKSQGKPIVAGTIYGDESKVENNILYSIYNYGYAHSIGFSKAGKFVFYNNMDDLYNGENGKGQISQDSKYWTFILDETLNGEELFAAFRLDTYKDGEAQVLKELAEIISRNDFSAKMQERTDNWNEILAKVPRPRNFSFKEQRDKGVSEEDVKKIYYKAWCLVVSNVLPKSPESGFDYHQVCTGKASLWGWGAEGAVYSAAWESFVGMQFLSYIDPDTAWDAYIGIMRLVDDDGMLGGESLPSIKAQTAWILYNNKRDKNLLDSITPALERYLNWRMENPRWIMGSHNVKGECDLDFVSNALVDMEYTSRIFNELGNSEKAQEWENKRKEYYEKFREWFIDGKNAFTIYNDVTGKRELGNILWLSKGLHIPDITDEDFTTLYKRFRMLYSKRNVLAGFGGVKFDSMQFPIYAFIDKGGDYIDNAKNMVEIAIRDITITNFLGEVYNNIGGKPTVTGVRPSLFGAGIIIDNCLIKNGYMFYDGTPKIVNLYGTDSGVENININGSTFNVTISGEEGKAKLGGSYFENEAEIDLSEGESKYINS